ncbi:Beta-glucosidase 17 [Citrus sinensis]|uniref:Beta-glucosidase 17 n=1 Tax=Citrus sinensis TaxID=2711 RepID=A0ACB8LMS8_CITSI|nr:Beta-glucosidase 17 [Citrus sinensis]
MGLDQGVLLLFVVAVAGFLQSGCTTVSDGINGTNTKPSHYPYSMPFNRTSFPAGFIFGAGSAAYQSEGAALEDGRGPSIWDTFVREHPDIKPFVTLLHFDPPQALEEEYGGFLSPKIVLILVVTTGRGACRKDFVDYGDFCFKTYGDRVKLWASMNEPNGMVMNGYNGGSFAPGRCSNYVGNCTAGDSATEPYIAAHNMLLSHGALVNLYKHKYQPYQMGKIGITILTHWFEPKFKTAASRQAASRARDFFFGWFADPVTFGNYPESMRRIVGKRLPKFTEGESKLVKGSFDFLAVNYYTTNYADAAPPPNAFQLSYTADRQVNLTTERDGVPVGSPTALGWLFVHPKGLQELLLYLKKKYNNPTIYITENGLADDASLPLKVALKDSMRIRYLHSHLQYLLKAIKEGVNVKAYYIWTFWDDFEWDAGYTVRFGITYVDFKNNLTRYLKYSAYWFKMFLLN